MKCPKCKSDNAEGAEYCTLCFHFFKQKEVGDFKRPLIRAVTSELGGWSFHGPLVIDPDALYFFIKEARFEAPLAAKIAARLAGRAGGIVGGVAAEKAIDAVEGAQPRPPQLKFDHKSHVEWVYAEKLTAAPELAECIEYFAIPRAEIVKLHLLAEDALVIEGKGFMLEIDGDVGTPAISGRLVLWRYPLDRKRPAGRRYVSAALLLTLVFVAWDFLESHETVSVIKEGVARIWESQYWFVLWYGVIPTGVAICIYFLIKAYSGINR